MTMCVVCGNEESYGTRHPEYMIKYDDHYMFTLCEPCAWKAIWVSEFMILTDNTVEHLMKGEDVHAA